MAWGELAVALCFPIPGRLPAHFLEGDGTMVEEWQSLDTVQALVQGFLLGDPSGCKDIIVKVGREAYTKPKVVRGGRPVRVSAAVGRIQWSSYQTLSGV